MRRVFETRSVARLATRRAAAPGLVPIVFAYLDGAFWSPVDGKPKASASLARVRDLRASPEATLLLDGWHSDWRRLWWIRVEARGEVFVAESEAAGSDEFIAAASALRRKIPQYAETPLFEGPATLLRLVPLRITSWAASNQSEKWIMEAASDG